MSEAVKIGGVQLRVNDDGTLFLYQPDPNRLLGPELAAELTRWLVASQGVGWMDDSAIFTVTEAREFFQDTVRDAAEQPSPSGHASSVTVPGGVIIGTSHAEVPQHSSSAGDAATSEGAVNPDYTNPETLGQAVADEVAESPTETATVKRRPGRPRKTAQG